MLLKRRSPNERLLLKKESLSTKISGACMWWRSCRCSDWWSIASPSYPHRSISSLRGCSNGVMEGTCKMHPFQLRFHWPLLQRSGDSFYLLLTDLAALESPEYHCIAHQYNLLHCRYLKSQHAMMLYYSFYFKKLTAFTFVHSTRRTFSCNCDHLITKIKSEKKKCEALFRGISLGEYVNSSVKTKKVTQKQ